jgi:hypothetical protein
VDNTAPPVITANGGTGDLGVKDDGFSWSYTVTHPDNEVTTVTEAVDGNVLRTFTPVLGQENTFEISREYFMEILNGKRVMTVTAVSGTRSAELEVTFAKETYEAQITLSTPLPADAPITKMVMNVTRNIPTDAEFKALATNNALDATPVWEDVTDAVVKGTNYVFENTTLVNAPAFNFRVSAKRGSSNVGGYINAIGGAFE